MSSHTFSDAVALDHIAESEARQVCRFSLGNPVAQQLAAVEVLHAHHDWACDGAVRPLREYVELVAVGVHCFQRMEDAAIALLGGERAVECFLALASEDQHAARQFGLDATLERLQGWKHPLLDLRDARHAVVAAAGGGRLDAEVIGFEQIPRLCRDLGSDSATGVGRHQHRQAVLLLYACNLCGPARQARFTCAAHVVALQLRGDQRASVQQRMAIGHQLFDRLQGA